MSSSKKSPPRRLVLPEEQLQTKSYAWHANDGHEVLAVLGVTEDGLSDAVAEQKLHTEGPNAFTENAQPGVLHHLWEQITSPLVFVLLTAFAITTALGEYVDAGVIMLALTIAVAVGIFQEGKASRAFEKLSKSQQKIATVIRSGRRHEIPAEELVVGDIVVIQNGMQVAADMRIVRSKKLAVNESALTGEWQTVKKNADPVLVGASLAEQSSMAWKGTFVAEGQGIGVVVATGDATAVGKLAAAVQGVEESDTPLQVEMKKVSQIMLYIVITLVLAIFFIGLWQGLSLHDMLLMSIAVAVASIPEGLPAAVTIILAVGMESLLKRGGLVRNLLAAETLGSTTYVLTDKTGTLTQATMAVTKILNHGTPMVVTPDELLDSEARLIFDISLAATDAYVDKGQKELVRGDSVEIAILKVAQKIGISIEKGSYRGERVDYLAFTSENRFAAGLAPQGDGYRLCVNGAPEFLIERSKLMQSGDDTVSLSDQVLQDLQDSIDVETKAGKRLVAVAYKDVDYDDIPEDDPEWALNGLTLAGILVLNDPVRPQVKDAISGVLSAGAEIRLVTGDNPQTALSIAKQVGIAEFGDDQVLTGDEIAEMDDETLLERLYSTKVYARVLPQQKLRLAQLLQVRGEIVAMTGDGINDAPALRRANIGIAIGSGTEVAKEASDLVLVNDSFETIHAAIEEGRRIISNLRKIVGYLLSTSLSEVVLVGAAVVIGAAVPIMPAQILWANIIEEGLMSVAFAFEKGEKNAMRRRPQDIHEEGILSKDMLLFMGMVITILSSLTLALYFYLRSLDVPLEELRSAMFLSISADSLFMAFAFRSLTVPVWKIPLHTNLFFVGSFLLSVVLLGIVLTIPFFQNVLSYTPLPLYDILLVIGFSVASLVTIELGKWFFFERRK